jgi:hypothetical protein
VRRQTDGVLERPSGDAVLAANVSAVGHAAMLLVTDPRCDKGRTRRRLRRVDAEPLRDRELDEPPSSG